MAPVIEIMPEPETQVQPVSEVLPTEPPTEVLPPVPPVIPPKKKSKLLFVFGGLAVILVSIALAITFFRKNNSSSQSSSGSNNSSSSTSSEEVPSYTNSNYFYSLVLPESWVEIRHSPLHKEQSIFNANDLATLEIRATKTTQTLDEILSSQDEANKGVIKSNGTSQVKVGQYDAMEREESWPAVGLQVKNTYVKISDMLYTFTLIPASGKNAITNDTVIRDYHSVLSSFTLTDTSQLGLDLKEYSSTKVDALAFKAFSLKYPQTWVLKETKGDNALDISIYRNNYELTISQKAIGGAVCLFSDSPAFEGSSGDLRNKQFSEFSTVGGTVLRRYFNINAGDKSTMFFCEKQSDGPYFQTPLTVGGLVYYVPAKYDVDIIKEMDEIVKTISPAVPSPSPSASVTPTQSP